MIRKFVNALNGLGFVFMTESAFRWELLIAFAAITLSFVLGVAEVEKLVIVVLCGAILSMEAINTAVERTCDFVEPSHNVEIGIIKDLTASAVFILCAASLAAAIIIFTPHIFG
jgi:diacylglycerol kinase